MVGSAHGRPDEAPLLPGFLGYTGTCAPCLPVVSVTALASPARLLTRRARPESWEGRQHCSLQVSLKKAALPPDGAPGRGAGPAVGRLHLRGPWPSAAWGLAGAGGVPGVPATQKHIRQSFLGKNLEFPMILPRESGLSTRDLPLRPRGWPAPSCPFPPSTHSSLLHRSSGERDPGKKKINVSFA